MKATPAAVTVIILPILVIAAGAYWYFFVASGNQTPLTDVSTNAAQEKFGQLVVELQSITFNTALLSDPRFTGLVDLTTPVAPEPIGVTDPFAPLSSGSGN